MNTTNTQDPIKLLDALEHAAMGYAQDRSEHTERRLNAARSAAIAALQSPAPQPPGFTAHDMATAAADGFRDGVASVQPPGDAREACGYESCDCRSYCKKQAAAQASEPSAYTYASKQSTNCAGCGEHKHTPLRIDAMGGYVCLTCIDKKLGGLLNEFGYASGPVSDGWQLSVADGHAGYGVYAHMEEYPEEGATLVLDLATPARAVEPLPDEKLLSMWSGGDERFLRPVLGKNKVLAFARAIERAHGIPAATPTQAAQGGEA